MSHRLCFTISVCNQDIPQTDPGNLRSVTQDHM